MRRVAVITGTRAEFGLLSPVMRAIDAHTDLELRVVAAGAHLLEPARTVVEVRSAFRVDAEVAMQRGGETGRLADARAFGRGVLGVADALEDIEPDWVLVLGDRIEAFAGAAAASIGGIAVAHVHGGDRAEGVADEAMRHATTKLAHLHLAATQRSAQRIVRMGEKPEHVHAVGSPAAAGIDRVEPLTDEVWGALGAPEIIVLHHPAGLPGDDERALAERIAEAIDGRRALWLHPNHDPGRETIVEVMERAATRPEVRSEPHLPHATFRATLRTLGERGGVLVGDSSAGLIEAALLRCPAVDIGPRQAGREGGTNVVHADAASTQDLRSAIDEAAAIDRAAISHPFGDGRAPERIAALLASTDPSDPALLRKRCAY